MGLFGVFWFSDHLTFARGQGLTQFTATVRRDVVMCVAGDCIEMGIFYI